MIHDPNMRGYLVFSCVLAAAFAAKLDLDPLDNLNEEEFEEEFHLDPVEDPEEKLRREEALVENENLIKETNQEYLNGEISWWDEVNEFADLPKVIKIFYFRAILFFKRFVLLKKNN